MSPMINLILLIIEVWFLVGILLILHWSSKKVGLTPLLVFMGGLTGALQLQSLGWVTIEVVGLSFNLDSNILLPVLLFGLLIVYVINGTLWARGILTGMIVVTIVAAIFQILLPIHVSLPGGVSTLDTAPGYAPRILIASIIAFALDLVSLILIYQTLCNLRNRFPSRLAAGTALLFALWCDAIIFPLVGFGGKAALGQHILSHLAGKSIVGIALYPLLLIYLQKSGLRFPDSSASIPRPALDFLTTSMQMEAQGRHHFSLLRTLSELNKLVVSSTDSQEILQQACRLIAGSRDYQLVCIALREGEKVEQLIQISSKNCDLTDLLTNETSPCRKVFNAKKHVVFNDIRTKDSNEGSWQAQAIQHGFRAVASFPMRYMGQLYGVFSVYLAKPYAFDKTEVEILQDLADDLAYALISIKARQQQAILQTAAETMQDGLLIADLEGNLVYVNSIVAKIAGIPTDEIIGLNIIDLLSKEQALDFRSTLNVLIKRGHLPLTIDYHSPLGRKIVISTHSALVHNEQGQPQHIVINIRDITSQRQSENQLVTLNRLTTDLVQIHDIQVLMENILPITEELLNSSASLIYTVDPDTKHVSDVLAHNLPDDCSQRFVQDDSNLSGTTALATLKPVYIPDTRTDPTYGEGVSFMTDANVRSLLIFPIVFHNSPIGILAVCHDHPQHYDENYIQLGKTLAQTLAIIIQNARLYEYSRRRVDEMTALVMASTALSTTLDYKKVLQVITEQLTKTLDIQACAISDYDSELNAIKLIVELSPDDWENDKDWNQPYFLDEYPLTKEILENNIPCQLRIDNPELDQAERDFMLDAGINFLLMLPLVTQDQTIGLIELMDEREDRFISDSQMMLIQALASQAAISIQNARLYQAERHQHQLAEALIQAASSLNSTLNLEEVFDEILKQVMQVVDCKAANFMMVADGYGYVRRYRGYDEIPGYLDIIKSIRIPTSTSNLSTMLNGEMKLVSDTDQDSSWIVYPGAEWIKSYIGIPLKIDQEVVGFLNVDSDIPGFFAEDAVRRLLTFADHAAIALKNADLYQQLHEYAAELETRVQNRTAELKAAKEHIEGILSSVPDAVFVLDQDHNLIQSNQAGKLMLEQAKKGNQDLFSPEFLAGVKDPRILEMRNLTEVDEFAYQARASDIYLEEGQLAGQVIVFRDVTRFKELDLLKSQFISDVSHELRTPLTNLTLYLGLFENDQIHGKQRTYLDILKRETERLTHLIEDLLTFSRIQLGKIDEEIQPLDINQIVHQLTIDRAFWAAKRDIRLTYRPLNNLPAAMANANGLSQVLSNLLTNAINYTPAGGRVILETDVKARKKQNWVVISVIDNGTGIANDEIPFIFDRFFRGSASHVTGAEGTGLGLAISKELVTRMGGEITFESSLGEGSSFHVWLRPPGSAML